MMYSCGGKRPFDAVERDLDPSSLNIFELLPEDCINEILKSLSIKQLLVFEQLNQYTSTGFYTRHQWKIICQKKKFNFDWIDLKKYHLFKHDKIRYLMGQGIYSYSSSRCRFSKCRFSEAATTSSQEGSQAFVQRYKDFACLHQFPSLKAYIFQDLKAQAKLVEQNFPLEQCQEPSFPEELKAGDLLLKGLYHLGESFNFFSYTANGSVFCCVDTISPQINELFERAISYLERAVQNEATLASLLAVRISIEGIVSGKLARLAYLSIEKRETKDYRALHELLHVKSLDIALMQDVFFKDRKDPPIFESLAGKLSFHGRWEEAEKTFEKAIESYGQDILPETWSNYSNFYSDFHAAMSTKADVDPLFLDSIKQKEINALDQAIAAYGEDVPFDLLLRKSVLCPNLEYARYLVQNYPNKQEEMKKAWIKGYK